MSAAFFIYEWCQSILAPHISLPIWEESWVSITEVKKQESLLLTH